MFYRNTELISEYGIWKCILCLITRKLCFNFQVSACSHPSALLVKPLGAVLRGISGRCERVRAGNINPSFWGCQGLDKSCLNFTLCKMPCVNSCPWPRSSDLVRQTPGAHPSPFQRARVQFGGQTGLKFSRINKQTVISTRIQQRKQPEGKFSWFPDRIFSVLPLAVFCHV